MKLALPALLLLALALPVAAQAPTFDHAYQVRGAVGNIPTTDGTEPAGAWNLEQRLTVQFDNASAAQFGFTIPSGARLLNATCTCNPSQHTATADAVVFTLQTGVPSGAYTLTVLTSQRFDTALSFAIAPPIATAASDRVAILYVPVDLEATAPVHAESPGLSTDGTARILVYEGFAHPFWVAVHPAAATAHAPESSNDDLVWVFLALGIVAGAVLWSVLVSRGLVQTKARKQVAGTAAHVEAAAEPLPVLEGRKRALLAALKDIEVAKMNGEMATDVYDVVKADLKRQAVTVMRALEAASAAEAKA
jgi:hypothetical protein